MLPLNPNPKPLPPALLPPNKDDWDAKEYGSLIGDDGVTPLSLLVPPFLCCCYLTLFFVPYPPRSRRCCRPLARICICLSSAATSILVKSLALSPPYRYLSSCPACPPPSYLRLRRISSSLRFVPPLQYFIPTPPPTLYLSISLLYIYIYLSSLIFSLLSLLLTLCLSIFL